MTKKSYNKKQIIDEFKKENIKVSKTTIVNYIKKLKANNIPIIAARKNGTDYYHLDKTEFSLDISILEVFCANDVKKLLVREKNLDNILTAMKLFYKFALLTSDKETRGYLCDFGYFSKINWTLFNELMQHCKNKDIVELEYLYFYSAA